MRKDCSLSKLTEEQLADLFDWLCTGTLDAVKHRVAKPPPDGFGIKTHTTSLSRFYQQRLAEIRNRDLADALASGPNIEKCKPFIDSARRNHAHATFALTTAPLTPTNYRAVSTTLFQHDDLELRKGFLEVARQNVALTRERLEFDRTQFEYNAARAALLFHVELAAIHGLADIDDEEKIWRVRQRLFGSPPPAIPKSATTELPAPQQNLAPRENSGGAK